ncbi:protein FAR1-RELATED SEQUENCE 5-like [Silene latifolia]|uniref:protein FAR1-RELATED SEQUENCE 5-like n=1 Tax=Silene latifolia TaxID=37657 RepID=UPI003D783D22
MVIISSSSTDSGDNGKEDDSMTEEVIDSIPATNVHASDILVVLPLTYATDSIVASNVDALMNNDIPPMIPLTNAPETPQVGSENTFFGFPSCPEDLKPINGMMFLNLEDGIEFYNKYAKVCGFIPRLDSTKLVNRIVIHKRCVCNKEGKSRNKGTKRKRTVTRTGCEAKVSFKRIDTGEYQIMILLSGFLRMFKEYVKGYKNVGASLEDFKNFSRDVKKYIKEYDAEMLWVIAISYYNYNHQCKGINQAVKDVFGDKTQHRLCMWHIMKKLRDKVGPTICQNTNFLKEINSIVWDGEIDTQEFELRWKSILSSYELSDHEWLKSMFDIRSSWIPAYFRDIYLGGIMRTTSRSESENSFFGNFTNPHLTLVEFWMRFQSAKDAQRWKYAKVTADDKNSSPKLSTPLFLEKKTSEFYTTTIFYQFQEELQAACFTCGLSPRTTEDNNEHISIMDREKDKVYTVDLSGNKFSCSCKMFERIVLHCKHVLWVLKDRGFYDIPREYLLDRWGKYATCRPIFNVVGTTLLADCMSIENHQSKISELWSEVFTSVSLVEDNEELGVELLELLRAFNEKLMISVKHGKSKNKKAEIEMLIGSKIPSEASVLPPEKCKNKGSGRRITSNKEKAVQENEKPLRKCRACGEMTHHDSRNCPSRATQK